MYVPIKPCLVAREAFLPADAMLTQNDFAFGKVALGFLERPLAFHHAGAGALAKRFD